MFAILHKVPQHGVAADVLTLHVHGLKVRVHVKGASPAHDGQLQPPEPLACARQLAPRLDPSRCFQGLLLYDLDNIIGNSASSDVFDMLYKSALNYLHEF